MQLKLNNLLKKEKRRPRVGVFCLASSGKFGNLQKFPSDGRGGPRGYDYEVKLATSSFVASTSSSRLRMDWLHFSNFLVRFSASFSNSPKRSPSKPKRCNNNTTLIFMSNLLFPTCGQESGKSLRNRREAVVCEGRKLVLSVAGLLYYVFSDCQEESAIFF